MGFSLASINLHGGLDRHGRPYPVTEAVGALDADVILVQENWRPHGMDSLARRAAQAHGYGSVAEHDLVPDTPLARLGLARGPVPDETGAWGIAILSRLPLRAYTTVLLGMAPGDVGERFAQIVEVPLGEGSALRVVNTHLTHRLVHGPRQLRRLLGGLGSDGLPAVIGGDLNMCRPTVHLAAPYRPAVRGRSWPAHRPVAQIDHLLAGPGVEIIDARVLPGVGSDHLPVRGLVVAADRDTATVPATAAGRS